MQLLTKEQIQAAKDRHNKDVEIEEWGGTVRLRTLTGREREEYENFLQARRKGKMINLMGAKCELLLRCIINEDGKPMFDRADLAWMNEKSAKATGLLFDVAMSMNGLSREDIDELVGNSEGDPNDEAGSDSPPDLEVAQ